MIRRCELEQTQELLVGLTNELFEKVERMESKKKSTNKKMNTTKKASKNKEKNSPKENSNIIFSDLTWYRKKLEDTPKK